MRSITTREFRTAFRALPAEVRKQARVAYRLFRDNPSHPSLHFKKMRIRNYYSVRIGAHHRAIGVMDGSILVWHWIGHHSEYDRRL